MEVNPSTMTLSPGLQPGGGARISTLSGVEAHMTMASDTMPLDKREFVSDVTVYSDINKTNYFRLCLSYEVSSERPKRDL